MTTRKPTLAGIVHESAKTARHLAATARQHHEPEVADRFEQIAADGEARARRLAVLAKQSAARARRQPASAD